ncbi:MAG: sugar phosphate isomerase/epimerase [Lentisphaeria bacterium]|nr:sugar phosphate isomerase/epimerase [Lentisphaeria bacterium]
MIFAMCNEFCQGWTIDAALRLAADVGYEGIEVAPFTLAEDARSVAAGERARIRAAAEQRGVRIIGLHWLLVSPAGLYINHPSAEVRQRTLDYLRALVCLCGDLGGDRMVIGSPKQRNVLPGCDPEQARQWAVDTFRALLPDAEERGVTLCLEPLARSETNFVNTVAQALELVAEIDHPRFRAHLDVKAMCDEGRPLGTIIREAAGRVGHLHVNDANRNGPGWGDTDYAPIVAALRDIGYDDVASVEVFDFSYGAERIARSSLEFLQRVFAEAPRPNP